MRPVRAEESTGALGRSGVLRRLARDKVAVDRRPGC